MGILASLFRAGPPADSDYWYRPVGTTSLAGVRVDADTAMKLSAAWACVRVISEGVAQVPFTYIDDQKNCVYRIVAPFGVDGLREVVYEVDTFTKQAFDAGHMQQDTPEPQSPAEETPAVIDPIP